jgi:hypothetical protein
MTGPVLTINKQTPEPRSRERQALAVAIEAAAMAARATEGGLAAVARASELVDDAQSKHAAASATVSAAKERHTAATAEAIGRGAPVPASAVRAARAAQADAEDDLDAAKAALKQLQTALAGLEEEAHRADIAVEAAVNSVLAGEAAVLLVERLEHLKRELPELQAKLYFLKSRGFERQGIYSVEVPALHAPLAEIESRITSAIELGLSFHVTAAEQHPAVEPWRAACAALRDDPDVPLPP